MKNKLPKVALVLFFTIFSLSANAQEVYGTDNGLIHISAVINDTLLTAISKELIVILNYDNATFKILLDRSSLRTGIDSIDNELKKLKYNKIELNGRLGIDQIRTIKHPPQDFEVNGFIKVKNEELPIVGGGHLEHIFGKFYSCIINLDFYVNPKDLQLDSYFQQITGDLKIEVIQSLLNRKE